MANDISDALSTRDAIQLTPGRHALVASQIKARLNDAEKTAFGTLIAELEADAANAVSLSRSRSDGLNVYGVEARDADAAVDATLATLDVLVAGYARAHGPETEPGRAARELQKKLLPRGLAGITQASYPDELAQVNSLLADSAKPEIAALVAKIPGLAEVIAELSPRAAHLRSTLDRAQRTGANYAEVVAAVARAEARLAELVSGIVFQYRGDAADAVARRQFLLEPYSIQVGAMRDRFRRRVPSTDVDPETGEDLPLPTVTA